MDILIVSIILILTFLLLMTEKIPIDLTALGIIVSLMVTGVLTFQEGLQGFANQAVITVGALFIVSRAMMRTGALEFVTEKIIDFSKGSSNRVMITTLSIVALSSAFINNTPVVVLFVAIIMSVCCKYGLSPSKFMIPVSYASILAGTCTLIGTSTNILVSELSAANGYGALTMFELSSLGIPIALLGIVCIYFVAARVLPGHIAPVCELQDNDNRKYLAEFLVREDSPIVGRNPVLFFQEEERSIEVLEVVRRRSIYYPDRRTFSAAVGDILLVRGSANDLVSILGDGLFELPYGEKETLNFDVHGGSLIVELVVPPQSSVRGASISNAELNLDPEVQIIAVRRREVHYTRQKLSTLHLTVGDMLLIHCPEDHLDQIRSADDFIILEDVHRQIIFKKKAPLALGAFLVMIGAATSGIADIGVCAVTAAFVMLLGGCLPLREAYHSLDVRVLLIIIGTLALGHAMQKTGADRFYAAGFMTLFRGQSPAVILSAFILLTSICTHLLSNNATAVLLIPIGISVALTLGVSPKPFIIGICFGASACFATPIGYQTNLLVYGPGGYRFVDYLKLGMPLNFLVWAMASLCVPIIWPF